MATLATWGRSVGLSAVLVSEDKDMWQLVRDRVHIMSPKRYILSTAYVHTQTLQNHVLNVRFV
jgi:5'-3' exonuclease